MSKSKQQGTRFETALVQAAHAYGLHAERIAEGGVNDRGDIYVTGPGGVWTFEAKDRQQMNIHDELRKAAGKADTPRVAVVWKRMRKRKPGHRNRQSAGIVVALDLPTFLELISERKGPPRR